MDTINGTDFDENSVTELSTKSPSYFERCVKFNFENHFDSTFSSGSGFCTGANPWTLSNFTLLEINCFHPLSTSFIAPTSTFSCITSPNFLMSDGTLEFNVYMGNVSRSNFPLFWMIKILVQVKSHDGTDNTIATTSYNSHSDNFVPGWNTLKINVENLWQEGHIVLMGMKTEGSIVFIDSFRFIPSTMNDDMCTLYKNQITTPSLTTNDSESTKITVTEAWKTESTNSGHETTENNQETNEQQTDATVSESFTRSTDFYDKETKTTVRDQWVTTADTITDSTVTESWITKTTNINNQETTMAGIWTLDPTSSTDTETESTDLNEDAATVTTVKEMWTTTSKPNSTECIKYDFEKDFDKLFSSRSGNCRGMTPWTLHNLTSVELESNLHPSSRLCISPKTSLSCVTSFSFLMGSGTLEFNVYIGDSQFSNAINILVMESSEGGFDSYFRNYMYTPIKYTTPSISTVVSTTEMDTINGTDFDENSVTELSTKSPSYFERCVKFNFENHFDSTFSSGSGFCTGANPWTLSNFTLLEMNCFYPLSTSFIAPTSTFSCITSPNFLMSDGTLEFNVYMGNVSRSNFPLFWMIKILVQVKCHDGTDKTIATTSYNSHSDNFVPGWNTLKINVENLWQEGHVTFLGRQDSILLIDSFRYIPSTMNEEDCVVYDSKYTTPSISTVVSTTEMDTINGTDFDENSVTELSTKSPSYFERCVKFNFENHFDSTFSSGSGFCTGANPWTLSNFTLLEINCFHPLSTSFIAPTSTFSCITSPNFLMSDGTLEFNVYMGNVSRSNFPLFWMIKILVQVKSHDGTDNTIATTSYNSHSDNFVPGWNTLKINVENLWQEGHVSFIVLMGMKTEGSIVFIDSFRFIPSTMNDDMCTLYKNQITTPSLTTDDSESTKFTVTEAWKTESTNSGHETTENNQETNEQQTDATVSESFTRSTDFYDQETKTTVRDQWVTTAETITDSTVTESWITKTTNINNQESTMAGIWTLDPTSSTDTETESTDLNEDAATVTTVKEMWTTTSKPNSTECIKYDFEKDFDKLFSSRSGNCRGMTPWTLNNLTSVELESNLHPSSRLCISPKTSLSCVTSFSFLMGSGTLEFNVYIGDSQFSNAINILVMESSEGGFDSYFRNYMYTPMSPNFVLGWNVLRIALDSPRDFEGYIVLQGALAELNSVVLVDSFRYIPSTIHEELCKIYQGQ
ncbi:hypothetical protein ABMA28_010233 [Loxostege sticticalis]|uniref:Midgut protein n=1 Tax=Loxostege sticticalis TaxID=481309 RepID=A0ABD0SA51_LOXSC